MPDGTGAPLVGDGNAVPMPTPESYADNKVATESIKVYDTCHGVKRHVPLVESTKTDLHRAVDESDPARLADLLETGLKASIDQQNMEGSTALHLACKNALHGVDFGRKDPARIACAQLLVNAGAKLDLHGPFGYTPLMTATVSHYPAVEVCEMLVNARANLLEVEEHGNTALHLAAMGVGDKNGQLKQLLKHPDFMACLEVKNKEGKTALQIAKEQHKVQEEKVELSPYFSERVMLLHEFRNLDGEWALPGEPPSGQPVKIDRGAPTGKAKGKTAAGA